MRPELTWARARLRAASRAVFVTRDTELGVHAVLVNAVWLSDDPPTVGFVTRRHSRKVRNLVSDARAVLTVVEGAQYVSLCGRAEVAADERTLTHLAGVFQETFGRAPRPAPIEARVAVVLGVERVLGRSREASSE